MIRQAIKWGVSEAKIAKALNINPDSISRKKRLTNGICPEVIDMLKDKPVPEYVFTLIRKVKAVRQIDMTTLMQDAETFSVSYARALLAATPTSQLIAPDKPKGIRGLSEEQMARMETGMEGLQKEFHLIEENYGADVLHLTLAKGYFSTLVGNPLVTKYLRQYHPDFLSQFEKLADMISLDGKDSVRP